VDYERRLIADGWTLEAFLPERRTRPDRRQIHRFGQDRRRRPSPPLMPKLR
jgi:hypothetical protein